MNKKSTAKISIIILLGVTILFLISFLPVSLTLLIVLFMRYRGVVEEKMGRGIDKAERNIDKLTDKIKKKEDY